MRTRELTLHERIRNADASQQVENIKAEHAYLHGRADTVGEFSRLWALNDDSSWGHAFGRMRGKDQIWFGAVSYYDMQAMQHFIDIFRKYPEAGGKDPRTLLEASVHTLVTDIIEVASDGMSARGEFLTPGLIQSKLMPDEPYCMILWERYGSDFVFEDGRWKYFHEQCCPDINGELDKTNWARDDYQMNCRTEGVDTYQPEQGTGTVPPPVAEPGPLHDVYSCVLPPKNTVPWPEPYDTMDDNNTYAAFRSHKTDGSGKQ